MGRLQEGESHPLQNPLILEMIFQKASFHNVKSYRHVCKQWYISSIKFWKSTSKVSLSGTSQMNGITKYLKLINNKKTMHLNSPFSSHFRLKNLEEDNPAFWNTFASSIKSLELVQSKFPSAEVFRRIIFKDCPNLEHLTLDNVSLQNGDAEPIAEPNNWEEPEFGENPNLKSVKFFRGGNHCISFMELFSHFPALETLRVSDNWNDNQKIFQTIRTIRQHDSSKLKLKHLHNFDITWVNERRPGSLQVLLDPNISLESLSVVVVGYLGTASFLEVLDLHRETLKGLSIGGNAYNEDSPLFLRTRTPVLPKRLLESLKVLTIRRRALPSMAFLKMTPFLTKLVLEDEASEIVKNTKSSDMKGFNLPSCRVLEIDDFSMPQLEKVMDWLPNVEVLKVSGLDNSKFSLVCERWPCLVSLEIRKSRVTDHGITGLLKKNTISYGNAGSKKSSRRNTTRKPNITDLKSLKYFSLDTEDKYESSQSKCLDIVMSYEAAQFGIEQLTNLKKLQILNYKLDDETLWKELLAKYRW